MALQFNFNSQLGVVFSEAYAKIYQFSGDKSQISFNVVFYVDRQARDGDKQSIDTRLYVAPYSDVLSISVLYEYLKTLPEFADAVDC